MAIHLTELMCKIGNTLDVKICRNRSKIILYTSTTYFFADGKERITTDYSEETETAFPMGT